VYELLKQEQLPPLNMKLLVESQVKHVVGEVQAIQPGRVELHKEHSQISEL
jgi:LytS/YehU family sensor histidine kinase